MDKTIVALHGGEPRASTWNLKDGFGFVSDHRYVTRMVEKHKIHFEEFGIVASERQQSTEGKRGRPIEAFLLNEDQCIFLATLFRNTEEVLSFKTKLVKEFSRMKKELIRISSQRQNAEWLETRKAGKETRRISTDTIERFIQYATDQGSRNAIPYYSNISKMENKALFILEQKYPNLREALNIHQLSTVKSADMIVVKALDDGMSENMSYKSIYLMAKNRVESFAEIIGKTLIPECQLKVEG
jgi:phage regulator Rha-like protein